MCFRFFRSFYRPFFLEIFMKCVILVPYLGPPSIQKATLSVCEGLGDEIQCSYDGETGCSFVFLTQGELTMCSLCRPPSRHVPRYDRPSPSSTHF